MTNLSLLPDPPDWSVEEKCGIGYRKLALVLMFVALFPLSAAATCMRPAVPPLTATALPPADSPRLQELKKKIKESMATQAYRAIAFGDSIMFGWPEELLYQAVGTPTLNAAIGGGTQTLIWQLETTNWDSQTPELVILLVGTNNLGGDSCGVVWGIRAAIAAVHARFPKANVVYVSLLPRGDDLREKDDKIVEINAQLKKAADHEYTFLDAHDALLCNHKTPCALFQPGNLHLTAQGYDVLNPLLENIVKSMRP
jgi:lysophospholipase L1-like esterase